MSTAATGAAPIIEVRQIEKFYAQPDGSRVQVIAPTDLAIYSGQILALLGPSGCGKSTLLRMMTGLAPASAGSVLWHGQPVRGESPNVSIVFQSFALFPWLTVLENVEAPLEARGFGPIDRHKRALRIIDAVGLDGFESAYPKELSGGMKQRVGVARWWSSRKFCSWTNRFPRWTCLRRKRCAASCWSFGWDARSRRGRFLS